MNDGEDYDVTKLGWMHIYPQYSNHSPAYIRSTKEGLEKLRDAIDAALAGDETRSAAKVYTNDGEGYSVHVQCINVIDLLGPLPYSEESFDAERARCFLTNTGP